jgi:hypothetical protein
MPKLSRVRQSLPIATRFLVGRDRSGRWAVADEKGLVGGLFNDRASAVQFAMEESHHVPGAVQCLPDDITVNAAALFGFGRKQVPQPAGRRL